MDYETAKRNTLFSTVYPIKGSLECSSTGQCSYQCYSSAQVSLYENVNVYLHFCSHLQFYICHLLCHQGHTDSQCIRDCKSTIHLVLGSYCHRNASNPLQGYATAAKLPDLSKVVVVGVLGPLTKATLNGQPISGFAYNASTSTLTLTNFAVTMDKQYTIMWQ